MRKFAPLLIGTALIVSPAFAQFTGSPSPLANGTTKGINTGDNSTITCTAGVCVASTGGAAGISQLTGDVTTASGSGSQAATIANNAVTTAKVNNAAVTEAKIGLSDVTTDNVSTTAHGFAPKAPNDATKYLDGTGAYSVPAGSGSVSVTAATPDVVVTPSPGTGTFTIGSTAAANTQSGVSYTVVVGDAGKTINRTYTSGAMTDTLPAIGSNAAFGAGFRTGLCANSTQQDTLSVTTNTINGASSIVIPANTCIFIADLDGVQYVGWAQNYNASLITSGTLPAGQLPAFGSGDVSFASGGGAGTIAANAVTNAKAAQMATHTIKGNNTGGTANAADLTDAQVAAELPAFVGDSGSGGTKGSVPAPASGDAAAAKFLKADGTWSTTPGGGTGCIVPGTANRVLLDNGTGCSDLGAGTTTTVLHGNAGGAPTFGAVNLANDTTGTLPAASQTGNSPYCEAWITAASTIAPANCGTVSSGTWTAPSWVTSTTWLHVEVLGPGGSGGGCNTANDGGGTGGTGGAAILDGKGLITASTGYSFVIGAGGAAIAAGTQTAGNDGTADTTLTIGGTTYTGGKANGGVVCTATTGLSLFGGTATNGTVNINGGAAFSKGAANEHWALAVPLGLGSNGMTFGSTAQQLGSGFGYGGAGGLAAATGAQAGGNGVIHIRLMGQ